TPHARRLGVAVQQDDRGSAPRDEVLHLHAARGRRSRCDGVGRRGLLGSGRQRSTEEKRTHGCGNHDGPEADHRFPWRLVGFAEAISLVGMRIVKCHAIWPATMSAPFGRLFGQLAASEGTGGDMAKVWVGRVISWIPALLFGMSAVMKLMMHPMVIEGM